MVTASSQTTDDVNHYNTSTNSNRQFKPTIPNEFLLASYQLTYIIHDSKLVAFVIAWNLIMEYIVIVALISKALIIYIDALFFSSMGHLNQIIPMEWYLGKYFDVCAMFIPIVIGGKLLQIQIHTPFLDFPVFQKKKNFKSKIKYTFSLHFLFQFVWVSRFISIKKKIIVHQI